MLDIIKDHKIEKEHKVKSKPTSIQWVYNYEIAYQKAKSENKILMLFFTSDQCSLCDRLKNTVFTDQRVINYINDNFVPCQDDKTKYLFKIGVRYGYPTLVFRNYDKVNATWVSGPAIPLNANYFESGIERILKANKLK